MWLYSATIFTAFTYLACSSDLLNVKRRLKQDGNHISAASHRRRNRLSSNDKEEVQIPMKIPKLSRAQKIALIIESGQNPFEKKRKRKEKGRRRLRKSRHVHRYPQNAYLLLEDNDGDEPGWNLNRHGEMQQQESNRFQNPSWEVDMETTTSLIEADWETVTESYDNHNYWRGSTSWYWDTTRQPYWTETTPYWDVSTSRYQQTTTDYPFWRRNMETETTNTTTLPTTTTTYFTTTGAPSVHEVTPDVTEELIWGRLLVVTPSPPPKLHHPLALPIKTCPHRFDAVTRAFNGRTYVFARDRVYQLWRNDNLHQKASFLVNEMFPDGPRTVTVAYTNSRSGVTVLIEHQTVYRYRWNRKNKVFYLARKSPQKLTKKMPVYPRAGFQWVDGNQVLVEGENFATYDAYWNVPTFTGLTTNYFPQFPPDLIGSTYQNDTLFILYTASNKIQIYDTGKYRVIQEYPIQISEFIGCINA
uniref:Olfactomedin-like domain-containing protein n=1 Tax=Elaeophora elaphi TaxID=1147741 RepID=A0A0R3RQ54_9BILA